MERTGGLLNQQKQEVDFNGCYQQDLQGRLGGVGTGEVQSSNDAATSREKAWKCNR